MIFTFYGTYFQMNSIINFGSIVGKSQQIFHQTNLHQCFRYHLRVDDSVNIFSHFCSNRGGSKSNIYHWPKLRNISTFTEFLWKSYNLWEKKGKMYISIVAKVLYVDFSFISILTGVHLCICRSESSYDFTGEI